jgi:hypothetical protein
VNNTGPGLVGNYPNNTRPLITPNNRQINGSMYPQNTQNNTNQRQQSILGIRPPINLAMGQQQRQQPNQSLLNRGQQQQQQQQQQRPIIDWDRNYNNNNGIQGQNQIVLPTSTSTSSNSASNIQNIQNNNLLNHQNGMVPLVSSQMGHLNPNIPFHLQQSKFN